MSDTPEKFMTAAENVLGSLSIKDDQPGKWKRWCDRRNAIARALMAADEAATKRERERCAGIANDLQYSADATFNDITSRARMGEKHLELAAATAAGMSHQARKAAAAILKGDA